MSDIPYWVIKSPRGRYWDGERYNDYRRFATRYSKPYDAACAMVCCQLFAGRIVRVNPKPEYVVKLKVSKTGSGVDPKYATLVIDEKKP